MVCQHLIFVAVLNGLWVSCGKHCCVEDPGVQVCAMDPTPQLLMTPTPASPGAQSRVKGKCLLEKSLSEDYWLEVSWEVFTLCCLLTLLSVSCLTSFLHRHLEAISPVTLVTFDHAHFVICVFLENLNYQFINSCFRYENIRKIISEFLFSIS